VLRLPLNQQRSRETPHMHEVGYRLRAKSGAWSHHPDAHDPEYRLLSFALTAERAGGPLGGNNVQAVVGAPDQKRYRLDQAVAVWLPSGWWVSLRNQLAQAPEVGTQILESVEHPLSEITAELGTARGARTEELTRDLFAVTFDASGPDYWR
jgi:hypothetical protein